MIESSFMMPRLNLVPRNAAAVEFALTYISSGYFGQASDSIHDKVAHLMRLIESLQSTVLPLQLSYRFSELQLEYPFQLLEPAC